MEPERRKETALPERAQRSWNSNLLKVKTERRQYFFVAKYKSGKIGTGIGEEMTNINYEKYGAYIPEIIPIDEIKNIKLLPEEIKSIIISNINEIFKDNEKNN